MLVLELQQDPERPHRFIAFLDGSRVVVSDQPVVDAARALLTEGFEPETLLTARHVGSPTLAFEPLTLKTWAHWTYSEGNSPLKAAKYIPVSERGFPMRGGPKSGVSDEAPVPT